MADLRRRLPGRLVALEPLTQAHEDDLRAAAQEGEIFTWLPVDLGADDALGAWLADAGEAAAREQEVPFAIVWALSGHAIGSTRFLEIRLEHLRAEIGWTWLAQSAWGSGANIEAKLLLLSHAFEHVGLRRVEFKTDARNERSRGALEALGAQFEGIFRKHMVMRHGAPRDSAYYSVIEDEWPEVKAGLERRLEARSGGPA